MDTISWEIGLSLYDLVRALEKHSYWLLGREQPYLGSESSTRPLTDLVFIRFLNSTSWTSHLGSCMWCCDWSLLQIECFILAYNNLPRICVQTRILDAVIAHFVAYCE